MISMKQIANMCNVSVATVSKALADRPTVNPQTRERIIKVAQQFNYRPNALIQSIQRGRTMTIAVACNRIYDPFGSQMMRGILTELHKNHYECLLFNWDQNVRDDVRILQIIGERRVDGLLMFPPEQLPPADYMTELRAFHRPIVTVDQAFTAQDFDFVGTDDALAMQEIAQHLYALGHQNIGHLYNNTVSTGQNRNHALTHALAEVGLTIPKKWTRPVVGHFDDSYTKAVALLSQKNRPTALVCFNDHVAVAAYAAAYDLGLSVPTDLSIIGFADLPEASTIRPALTTVNQNVPLIGERAAQLLIERIKHTQNEPDARYEPKSILMPVHLVERDSTTQAPNIDSIKPANQITNTFNMNKKNNPIPAN